MKKLQCISFCIFILIITTGYMHACFAVDVVEATQVINQAELNLNSAFSAVNDAYEAGADIEGFLEKLDLASGFLSNAKLAMKSSDYELASSLAMKCNSAVDGISTEATILMTNAVKEKTNSVILTVIGSSVGLALLIVFGIAGWRFLKKHHYKHVFEMKPEVEES